MSSCSVLTDATPQVRTTFETLTSSCVVIEERVDPEAQKGVYPANLRGKGDYSGDLRKVPCHYEAEEHIAADQIFPLIKTGVWYTPTIKHHCPRTALASSLRACSNKVGFDPEVFAKYQKWFRNFYIPHFLKCLDHEVWTVDLDEWLKKYPIGYRNKIKQAIDPNHVSHKISHIYEAFTKVEMQFTTVPHSDKDTPLNDTKERQICGPVDEKKAAANAFINILELVASKYFESYCGRANWIDICASLEKIRDKLKSHTWGASDGSGFDMTQYPEMNKLMNELIIACTKHPNVHIKEPLRADLIIAVLEASLRLEVSVDHGDLKYTAVGRASGDGWTTFGNTMLMISYWMFTFDLAQIKDFGLKVKGDDVLFCVQDCDIDRLKRAISVVFTDKKGEHKHGLGQICKKINWGALTDLDFLSNEFFETEDGHYRMTRIPARVIQTLSWTTKLPHGIRPEKELDIRKQLCYSKGMCLKAWADGLPLFGVLADKMIELGHAGKWTCFDEYADSDRVWHKGRDDSKAYLTYLDQAYAIGAGEVESCERQIRGIKTLTGILDLPCLERLYHRL